MIWILKALADAGETLGWLGDGRDLKEFIKVKGGEYPLGKGPVTIKPFEMGKYPVTNKWFEEFINDSGYSNAEYWSEEGKKELAKSNSKQPGFWDERKVLKTGQKLANQML